MTIATLLGLTPVKPFVTSKATLMPCADPSLIMGLELEIEGIPVDPTDLYVPGMGGEPDNSLRVTPHGQPWEFITKPATFSIAAHILSQFFTKAKLSQERNYSERCSVHVHANVQDLEPEQLRSVCLLYQVMERLFYAYAGEDREANIFCVPWAETTMTHNLVDKLTGTTLKALRNWQKYTGLNLTPVQTLGTVEFRHLPGTCDLPRILGWMNMIGSLFRTARSYSYDHLKKMLMEVNTTSEYKGLIKFVFGEFEHLVDIPHMEELLEDGALNTKYILMSSPVKSKPEWGYPVPPVFDDMQEDRPAAAAARDVRARLQELRVDYENQQAAQPQAQQVFINAVNHWEALARPIEVGRAGLVARDPGRPIRPRR